VKLLGIATLLALVGLAAASQDVAPELEQAKALYAEGRFGRAIAVLQGLILDLQDAEGSGHPEIEVEAQLYMGLSYVALDDPDSAKESFVRLIQLKPERRLDPDVHAPKVVALYEEARREAALRPAPVSSPHSTTTATTSTTPPASESSSRLPWALVGGAAGAGSAVLVQQLSTETTTTTVTAPPPTTTTTVPPSVEVDARMNGLKEGTFSCSQGLFLTIDVVNHSTSLIGVDGFDLTMNTTSAECTTHRPVLDGMVDMDVLPGARIQIRRVNLAGDLCQSPGRVPGCAWRAVVVVVTGRGSFEDELMFNTIP
jgi:hypothetical protein